MTDHQTTDLDAALHWLSDPANRANPTQAADVASQARTEIERLRAENTALIADNAKLYEGWTAECNR